jgi:5-methylcytosine-specific restriction protein A
MNKLCSEPRCNQTQPCSLHPKRGGWSGNRWNRTNPNAGAYGSEWRRIRKQHLKVEPRCRLCQAPATQVDHIQPLSRGGTHARSNLRSLCEPCHRTVTASDFGWRGARRQSSA